MKFSHKRNCS